MAKLEASDTVVLGISIDSPAANAAFAKQIGVTFPLLSDMNKEVLTAYQILKPYDVKGGKYQWAQRTTIVVDKDGKNPARRARRQRRESQQRGLGLHRPAQTARSKLDPSITCCFPKGDMPFSCWKPKWVTP